MSTLEVLDGGTGSRFKLDDGLAIIGVLGIDNNLQVHSFFFHDALQSLEVDPEIVRVEDLEFADRLEFFRVLRRDLGNFEQANLALVIDKSSTLHVGLGLIGDLHDEFSLCVDHVLEDSFVNDSTEVIRVGNEQVLFSIGNQLIEDTGVQ